MWFLARRKTDHTIEGEHTIDGGEYIISLNKRLLVYLALVDVFGGARLHFSAHGEARHLLPISHANVVRHFRLSLVPEQIPYHLLENTD